MSNEDLKERLIRIEAKLDMLGQTIAAQPRGQPVEVGQVQTAESTKLFGQFTIKQHVAIQMILTGEKNSAIAERLGITENTAKVHVRTIAKKLGVKTRGQIVAKLMQAFNACNDDEYQALARGLPKNWAENFKSPDKFKRLYRSKNGT